MEKFEVYIESSNKHWQQALEYLHQGKLEKASEFTWGSVAARVKALALFKTNSEIRTHQGIRKYVRLKFYSQLF